METKILKGNILQEKILSEVKNEISKLQEKYNKVPGIAFIGFSSVPLAKYNIPFHVQLAEDMGFNVFKEIKTGHVTEDELFKINSIQIQKDEEWILILDDEFFSNPLVNMVARTAFIKAVPDDCALTFVNKNSQKLAEHCKRADYLVVATKYPEYVQAEWLKKGVCIIDIYSNLVKKIPLWRFI